MTEPSKTPRTDALGQRGPQHATFTDWVADLLRLCRELEVSLSDTQKACDGWERDARSAKAAWDSACQDITDISTRKAAVEAYAELLKRAADPLRIIVEDLAQDITPTAAWRKEVLAEWAKVATQSSHEICQTCGDTKRDTLNPCSDGFHAPQRSHAVCHAERDLLRIIVSGPHCIDDGTAVFYRDPGKPGNALHQLVHRVSGFLSQVSKQDDRPVLIAGIKAALDLMNESRGVAGLHLNGDEAPWQDLRAGGCYEEWLLDFDAAAEIAQREYAQDSKHGE